MIVVLNTLVKPMMLNTAKTLAGYKLHSLDGEMGTVEEFYFDDHHWTVRYMVASTGSWLTGRKVLISPYALTAVNKEEQYIAVNLTNKQIELSPSYNRHKPVSRPFEEIYSKYYGLPKYWNGPYMWGSYPNVVRDPKMWRESIQDEKSWDRHLRSTSEVEGYVIQASDGDIGNIKDFIIDDDTWAIRYLVVDTGKWWPGKRVLVSPQWIESVSWDLSTVSVNLSRDAVRQSPEYTDEFLLTRDYEAGLHVHYDRQGYWND